ncbi:MAG: hypothetical protein AB1716_02995 [Planctomycetota bacterium]
MNPDDPHDVEAYADWDPDDPEGPQECDLAQSDDDETETVPCPACGREVADFAERCPHCGDWIVPGASGARQTPWLLVAVALAAAIFLAWVIIN